MRSLLAGALAVGHVAGSTPAPPPPTQQASPAVACEREAAIAERRWGLPAHLLLAIGEVESGRRDPASGRFLPWPWSANVAGIDYAFATPAEASTAVALFQAHGVDSIDVGCFQVNMHYHPDAFAGTAQGFDPQANADYAGRFLRALFDRSGSWETAIGQYHSADPALGDPYRARVLRAWHGESLAARPATADSHVILMDASAASIPVYSARTLPPSLRAALRLPASRTADP